MTRHHAESIINILLTRYLPIDSGVRIMKPYVNDIIGLFVG